jgi:hypothetical protein
MQWIGVHQIKMPKLWISKERGIDLLVGTLKKKKKKINKEKKKKVI